jgi:hypothetical protein
MSPDALNSLLLCIGLRSLARCQRISGHGKASGGLDCCSRVGAAGFRSRTVPVCRTFIIMRNTLRGARIERRRVEFVMMATMLAGFWSLMSGTFFLMTLRAAGVLA